MGESPDQLTSVQLNNFTIIERVTSSFALLGCLFIFVTYYFSPQFHTSINKLIFLASIGNVFTNIATLISRSVVNDVNSHTCQFQAFAIQMFMPADAYWTLAMANNVYLTFYRKATNEDLKRWERWYCIWCYGVPFVVAFVYLFLQTASRGKFYGDATLWCWVSPSWDTFRIWTFYGPVWLAILITIGIYLRCGLRIWRKRQALRAVQDNPTPLVLSNTNAPLRIQQTDEFVVTHEVAKITDLEAQTGYRAAISGNSPPRAPPRLMTNLPTGEKSQVTSATTETPISPMSPDVVAKPQPTLQARAQNAQTNSDKAAWAYAKVALLFFVAMMVTWVPSSVNRVYSVVHPGEISVEWEYASAFVLPLQGFWNAIIYMMTSWPAVQAVWFQLKDRRQTITGGVRMSEMLPKNAPATAPSSRSPQSNSNGVWGSHFHDSDNESQTKFANAKDLDESDVSSRPASKSSSGKDEERSIPRDNSLSSVTLPPNAATVNHKLGSFSQFPIFDNAGRTVTKDNDSLDESEGADSGPSSSEKRVYARDKQVYEG